MPTHQGTGHLGRLIGYESLGKLLLQKATNRDEDFPYVQSVFYNNNNNNNDKNKLHLKETIFQAIKLFQVKRENEYVCLCMCENSIEFH